MDDHVYKLITVVGTSTTDIEDAVQKALTRASSTVRNMRWFQVTETRGTVENDKVGQWQVTIQVGFRLD